MRLADYFVLRVAERPVDEVLAPDRTPLSDALARLDAHEAWLDEHRQALCDRLHDEIAGLEPPAARRALLALRRAIFNDRPSPPGAASEGLGDVLEHDRELVALLEEWRERVSERRRILQAGAQLAREAVERRLEQLRPAWDDEHLRSGILVASPDLFADLRRARNGELRPARRRHVDLALVAYHLRAATKTSPFGTFTATGAGVIDGADRGWSEPGPLRARTSAALNGIVPDRLHSALREDPARLGGHLATLNPSLTRVNASLVVLRRVRDPARSWLTGIDEAFTDADATPPLQAAVELVGERRALTFAQLAAELAARLGRPAGDPALAAFVRQLVTAGLLEPDTGISTSRADGLRPLAAANGEREPVAALAAGLLDELAELPELAADDQAGALGRVATRVTELSRAVGAAPPPDPQGLVVLDAQLPSPAGLDRAQLTPLERDLARLGRLMHAFNAGFLMRRLVRRFLEASAPAGGVPLTCFLRDFYRDCYDPLFGDMGTPFWEPFEPLVPPGLLPEVEALAALRGSFTDECLRLVDGASARVELPASLVDGTARLAEAARSPAIPASVAFMGHLQPGDGGYDIVLNQILTGYGTYLSRHADGDAPAARELLRRLRARLAASAGPAELAEIAASFGFNAQMHPPLTRRWLPYPGEAPTPWPDALAWADLRVVLDEQLGGAALRDRDGRLYLPLCAGPLASHLMPLMTRMLMALGPAFVPDFSLLDLLEHRRGRHLDGIRRYPEVRLGRAVVQRATWRVPRAEAPPARRGRGELARFRDLRGWARELGVGRYAYVTPMRLTDVFRAGDAPGRMRRLYKPFFVDFEDPLSAELYSRYCDGVDGTLTVTEALPRFGELPFRRAERQHVSEVVLEVWQDGER